MDRYSESFINDGLSKLYSIVKSAPEEDKNKAEQRAKDLEQQDYSMEEMKNNLLNLIKNLPSFKELIHKYTEENIRKNVTMTYRVYKACVEHGYPKIVSWYVSDLFLNTFAYKVLLNMETTEEELEKEVIPYILESPTKAAASYFLQCVAVTTITSPVFAISITLFTIQWYYTFRLWLKMLMPKKFTLKEALMIDIYLKGCVSNELVK